MFRPSILSSPRADLAKNIVKSIGLKMVALALAVASPALAEPSPASQVGPTFAQWPNVGEMADAYPYRASRDNTGGVVLLGCDIDAEGYLTACKVYGEDPPNMDFGAASLKVTRWFRVKTNEANSAPGNRMVFTITWAPPGYPSIAQPNFQIGDHAGLFTGPDLTNDPTPAGGVACLSPQSGHACKFHRLTWLTRPDRKTGSLSVLKSGINHDSDVLICKVTPESQLTACAASGAEIAAVTHNLLPTFKVPKTADDGTPIGAGPVVIMVDWSAAWQAAKAYAPDTPDPSR